MKKLLLSIAIIFTTQFVFAGKEIVPLERGCYGVIRDSGNLYRPIPKGASGIGARGGVGSRDHRTVFLKPTQHYYTKDKVVSYRYAEDRASRGSAGTTYNGPRSAVFQPGDDYVSRTASVRTFAALSKRQQPGVPMVPKRGTAAAVERSRAVARR